MRGGWLWECVWVGTGCGRYVAVFNSQQLSYATELLTQRSLAA